MVREEAAQAAHKHSVSVIRYNVCCIVSGPSEGRTSFNKKVVTGLQGQRQNTPNTDLAETVVTMNLVARPLCPNPKVAAENSTPLPR